MEATIYAPGDTLASVAARLESASGRARALVCGVTDTQASWRPHRRMPTIGESLERWQHDAGRWLAAIGDGMTPEHRSRRLTIATSPPGRVIGRCLAHLVGPGGAGNGVHDPRHPAHPRSVRHALADVLDRERRAHDVLRATTAADLRLVRVRHPGLPWLQLPCDIALEAIARIAEHYLRRAEQVRFDGGFPRE